LKLLRQNVVRRTFEVVGVMIAVGSPLGAQTKPTDPHRWAGGLSVDLGGIPDAFGFQCGDSFSPVVGGGLTVIHRPRRGVVAVFDARASSLVEIAACNTLRVPPPVPIGANDFEDGPYDTYPRGIPRAPLRRTSLRIGLEAPPDRGVLRATIGGGWLWSGAQRPFLTGALEIGTNNGGPRFVAGIERSITWVRVSQEYRRFRRDETTQTQLPSRFDAHTLKEQWTTVRIGIELPLSDARCEHSESKPIERGCA